MVLEEQLLAVSVRGLFFFLLLCLSLSLPFAVSP